MSQEKLPGANTALVMGILSIVITLFCCGPFGAIFSIIGITNANSAERIHQQQPGEFIGYEDARTGKILSYIGLAIAIVLLVLTVIFFGAIAALITSGNFDGDF
jgi:hypothetical protein